MATRRRRRRTASGRFVKKSTTTRRRRRRAGVARTARRVARRITRRKPAVAKKTRRRRTVRRSTPSGRGFVNVALLKDAGVAAAGYVGADLALARLPLPAAFRNSPQSQAFTTIGIGLLFGVLGRRFIGQRTAAGLAAGMVTNGIVRLTRSTVPGLNGMAGCNCDGGGMGYMGGYAAGSSLAAMSDGEFSNALAGMLAAAADPFAGEVGTLIDADMARFN